MIIAMKQVLLTTVFCLLFISFFNVSAKAMSVGGIEDRAVDEQAYLDEDMITDIIENNQSQSVEAYGSEAVMQEDYYSFGSFDLTKGFKKDKTTTFSESKSLLGVGEEDTAIEVVVFYYEEDALIIDKEYFCDLGKSGVYNENLSFSHIGLNYVFVTVTESNGDKYYKLFKVVCEEEKTREQLENVQIDFLKDNSETPTIEEFAPKLEEIGIE